MDDPDEWHETLETVNRGRHGIDFEIETSKFLFKRLLDAEVENFKFTREKRGVGKFDDLIYIYETKDGLRKFGLVQLKHVADPTKTISYESLTTDETSYFFLSKYFDHYLDSLKFLVGDKDLCDADLEGLFICTNITFENDLKEIQKLEINNDGLFDNSGHLYKIKISQNEKRKVFGKFYTSNIKRLADELVRYIMLGKDIDINCLKNDDHSSVIKTCHIPLAQDVIDVSTKKIREEFLEGNLEGKKLLLRLRKSLFESLVNFCSSFTDDEEQLKTNFKIRIKNARELEKRLLEFKTAKSVDEFLKTQTLKIRSGFGDLLKFPDDDRNWFLEQDVDEDEMDTKIDAFLRLLIFAVKQNNHQNILKNEMGEEAFIAFSDKMNNWYHHGAYKYLGSNSLNLRKRQWLTKSRLQTEAMETDIEFQGKRVKLKQVVSDKNLLDSTILMRVFSSLKIKIGLEKNEISEVKSYYIQRCLWRQRALYKNVAMLNKKDTFIISHVKEEDYMEIQGLYLFCMWSDRNFDFLKSRLIIAGCDFTQKTFDDFVKSNLSQFISVNVHWLKFEKSFFLWKSTYGSLAGLQPYFQNTNQNIEILNEADIFQNNRFIILSGEPGIGKSTLLNSLEEIFIKNNQEKDEPYWIFRISLKDWGERLDEIETLQSVENIVEFLSVLGNVNNNFGKILLKYYLLEKERLVFLIDGFDELYSEERQEQIIDFLHFLRLESKVKYVIITTRPHLKDILEDCLGLISYSIKSISEIEQIQFLTQYWKQSSSLDEYQIGEYAKMLINNLNQATSHHGKSFLGIPLQTYMLAVVYHESFFNSDLGSPQSFPITSLFEQFLNKRYKIYMEKSGEKVTKNNRKQQLQLKTYDKLHQDFALFHGGVFSSEEAEVFMTQSDPWDYDILLDIGIVYKHKDNFYFTHKTFAEYLTIKRLVDVSMNIKKYNPDCLSTMAKIFLNSGNEFLVYLFDLKLTEHFPLHGSVMSRDETKIQMFTKEEANEKDCLGRKPLNYAIHYGSFEIVKILCQKGGVIGEEWEDWEEGKENYKFEEEDWQFFWMVNLTQILIEFWEVSWQDDLKSFEEAQESIEKIEILKKWCRKFLESFFKEVLKDVLKEIWKTVLCEVLKGIWKKSWEKNWERAWEEVWEELWEEDWKGVWSKVGNELIQEIKKGVPENTFQEEDWSNVWNKVSKELWMESVETFQKEFEEETRIKFSEEDDWRRIRKTRNKILKLIRIKIRQRIQKRIGNRPDI